MNETLSIGTKITLCSPLGSEYPYTVIKVTGKKAVIQECALLFGGVRYFDTVADKIVEDPNGRTKNIYLSNRGYWRVSRDKYTYVSVGRWSHMPYLD